MSRPKKWVNPVESRIKNDSRKKSTPTQQALDGFPFPVENELTSSKDALDAFPLPVKRDNTLGSQDSTKQLGEVAAAADNLTDGYDFSLIDSPKENPNTGLFTVKSANQVIMDAKNRPPRRRLFGQLWFEGENCILYSDTNLGKTILAYQIANSISSGRSILGLAMDAPAQKVAYCDFELSEMQFLKRSAVMMVVFTISRLICCVLRLIPMPSARRGAASRIISRCRWNVLLLTMR